MKGMEGEPGEGHMPTEEEIKRAFKEEMGRDATPKELEEFKAQAGGTENVPPPESEIRAAFKQETGRDPTAKELEEFKAQATGPEPMKG
jgi:hypothetical protein